VTRRSFVLVRIHHDFQLTETVGTALAIAANIAGIANTLYAVFRHEN